MLCGEAGLSRGAVSVVVVFRLGVEESYLLVWLEVEYVRWSGGGLLRSVERAADVDRGGVEG